MYHMFITIYDSLNLIYKLTLYHPLTKVKGFLELTVVIDSEEVVPVEIKCLGQPPVDNADFRKEVDLAKRQLSTVKKIIGCSRGVIVFLHMYKDGDKVIHQVRSAFV